MTTNLHAVTAPIFTRMLRNLAGWLEKAQSHAESKGFDPANYLSLRLAPDMLPFAAQVKIAGDIAQMAIARLAGTELPPVPDEVPSLATLIIRVRSIADQIEQVSESDLQAAADKEIIVPQRGGNPLIFTGLSFVQNWALPNVFFHVTTAYALLRHSGVDIGKADYLGLDQ